MKRIVISLMIVLPVMLCAQGIKKGTYWTDGSVNLYANSADKNMVYLIGGTLHEGGYGAGLLRDVEPGKYIVRPYAIDGDEMECTFGGNVKVGDEVEIEKVDGHTLLVARDHDGAVKHAYREYDGDLRKTILHEMMITYAGDYVDAKGQKWQFTLDGKMRSPSQSTATPITVIDIYEMPSELFRTSQGEYIVVHLSTTGLNLYTCKFDEQEEIYSEDSMRLLARLRRTGSPWHCDGQWPYTQSVVLSCSMAAQYDNATLRLMRNEILARHGYRFDSSDLQNYFGHQPWYTPAANNNDIKLSAVEQMNIDIIRGIEKSGDRDWVKTEK